MKNVTLKDVAREAGVSIPTVSRVLNNEKFVSAWVKKKVEEAAEKLNYEPQWSARSLRLRKTNIIGVIVPDITDYFFANIVLGVEKFFREKGKDIILFNTSNDEKIEEKAIKLAISKRVEGIILATIYENGDKIRSLMKSFDIPFVVVDNKIDVENVDFVLADDIEGSFKLVDHLIKIHGLKHIACINAPLHESSDLDKLIGYKKALTENNITIKESYIKSTYRKKDEAYEVTMELLGMMGGPEAIYCVNTNMLIGCLRYLVENNIRVPDDIAIVAFDDCDFIPALNPPVTTLQRIDFDMGQKAAELLFKRTNGGKNDYKVIRIDSELMIRRSCGCK